MLPQQTPAHVASPVQEGGIREPGAQQRLPTGSAAGVEPARQGVISKRENQAERGGRSGWCLEHSIRRR